MNYFKVSYSNKFLVLVSIIGAIIFSIILGYIVGLEFNGISPEYSLSKLLTSDFIRKNCSSPKDIIRCSDWFSALSSERQEVWSSRSFYISLFGVIGLLLSLIITIKATTAAASSAQESARAARVAEESLQHSRELARFENRPFLIFSGFEIQDHRNYTLIRESHDYALGFDFSFKNVGNTPALRIKIERAFRVIKFDEKIPIFDVPIEHGNGVIGKDVIFHPPPLVIVGDDMWRIKDREARIVVFIRVLYAGIWYDSPSYHTDTCLEATYQGQKVNQNGSENVFAVEHVGLQNHMT